MKYERAPFARIIIEHRCMSWRAWALTEDWGGIWQQGKNPQEALENLLTVVQEHSFADGTNIEGR